MKNKDFLWRRSMLFSIRMRFSPEVQPVKETAIEKIVEQNLLLAEDEGISVSEMQKQGLLSFPDGTTTITPKDLVSALDRLVFAERVVVRVKRGHDVYSLAPEVKTELISAQNVAELRFNRVVSRLFASQSDPMSYKIPFNEALCYIFAKLGLSYIQIIRGDSTFINHYGSGLIEKAACIVAKKFKHINFEIIVKALFDFFQDSNPDCIEIKWNLAQNFYIAKAIGLDPAGYILTEDMFSKAEFYLDTNIIIRALPTVSLYHISFHNLVRACQRLGVKLHVCQITLDELRGVVANKKTIIKKITNQIPKDTFSKLNDIFFRMYIDQVNSNNGKEVDLKSLFAIFDNPMERLKEHGVDLVDDQWFQSARYSLEVEELMNQLREDSIRRRGISTAKGEPQARHDALLLLWTKEARKFNKKTWVVTHDNSLPLFALEESHVKRPLAITMDALLQWLSPFSNVDDESTANIFSEAIKYQLLPQDNFFDMRDFFVFAEMGWQCKELPAEDVEGCITCIKSKVPNLDPSNPSDLLKLSREVVRYFSDPGRRYHKALHQMELQVASIKNHSDAKEDENAALRYQIQTLNEIISKQKEKRNQTIRLFVAFIVFVLIISFGFIILDKYGEGNNFFQRVSSLWCWLVLTWFIALGVSCAIIGKNGLRKLPWWLHTIIKGEYNPEKTDQDHAKTT